MPKVDKQVKDNLDLAWVKIQNALQQEDEGRKLWIEGTLELINILDDARNRLGSDQEFGTWLTNNGYGENRITRHDRSALLNMARDLNVTRKVLEQTHRRSWRHIWEDEIQPRLPQVGQPPDPKGPDAPDGKGPEPEAPTRRPKKKSKGAKPSWSGDLNRFSADALRIANEAIALQNTVRQCTPEALRKLQDEADTVLLEKLKQGSEALAFVRAQLDGPLEEEANKLLQTGRLKMTPARRAPASVQA
jgi:hypothetical protein